MKGRNLREDEQTLWDNFTRQVKILKEKTKNFPELAVEKKANVVVASKAKRISIVDHLGRTIPLEKQIFKQNSFVKLEKEFLLVGVQPAGLDNRSWNKFSKGNLSPERILDLHGYTAQEAFVALEGFLLKAQQQNIRCVEVITGIGFRKKEGGILRKELPFWLNRAHLRAIILGINYPARWNGGAVRILLKRNRLKK